ncbi:MAG: hypothetical protein R3E95_05110 [Thiolinea sp.]
MNSEQVYQTLQRPLSRYARATYQVRILFAYGLFYHTCHPND